MSHHGGSTAMTATQDGVPATHLADRRGHAARLGNALRAMPVAAGGMAPALTVAQPAFASPAHPAAAHHAAVHPAAHLPGAPDFGPNVYIFTPSMRQSQIQATVDSIGSQ